MVAPRVGAWIEIYLNAPAEAPKLSLPVWERGLKYELLKEMEG